MQNKYRKKSEPQFRTRLTQTGAILGSDFYFELAAATPEKKEKKETCGALLGLMLGLVGANKSQPEPSPV